MRKEKGFSKIILVLIIIAIFVCAGFVGKDVIKEIDKVSNVEEHYLQVEISKDLNSRLSEKLVEASKAISGTSNDIGTVYCESKIIDEYLEKTTVEGMYTLKSIHKLVRKKKVKMPIINLIHDIIIGKKDIQEKSYSFLAGQYFKVKMEYVEITHTEFENTINTYMENLNKYFLKGKVLQEEIKHKVGELRYEEI